MCIRDSVTPSRPLVIGHPSYETPVRTCEALDLPEKTIAVNNTWQLNLDEMAEAAQGAGLVYLCNPNNPTGVGHSQRAIREFVERVAEASPETVILIDEAYIEFAKDSAISTALPLALTNPNVMITRTFSKIYGLAALRVGYAVASEQITDVMNRIRHPFNVNSIALAAAVAALDDQEFVETSRMLNREQMTELCEGFRRLGLEWIPSVGNFVTVDVGQPAADIFHKMLLQGVIVRPVANYGMPNHLRFTVGLALENEKALRALEQALCR